MKLTILGLPLGNIEDISLRAIKTLVSSSMIICEDTRVFNKLWMKLVQLNLVAGKFPGKLFVLTDFSEGKQALSLTKVLEKHGEATLISDAGMPLVSDPGFKLVREILKQSGEVQVIPGPTAAMTALVLSGLSTDKVLFIGFLPQKNSKRSEVWNYLKHLSLPTTIVVYESPYRLKKTLAQTQKELGNLEAAVSFELTKQHERTIRGKLSEVVNQLSEPIKGEVTLVFRFQ